MNQSEPGKQAEEMSFRLEVYKKSYGDPRWIIRLYDSNSLALIIYNYTVEGEQLTEQQLNELKTAFISSQVPQGGLSSLMSSLRQRKYKNLAELPEPTPRPVPARRRR